MTYISYVEVNSYFWRRGLFKQICKELMNHINPNQYIICSMESDMGKEIHIRDKLKKVLQENGFKKDIFINDYNLNNRELYNLLCGNGRKRKK